MWIKRLKEVKEMCNEDCGNCKKEKCVKERPKKMGDGITTCIDCGAGLIFNGGCKHCAVCGWSACG